MTGSRALAVLVLASCVWSCGDGDGGGSGAGSSGLDKAKTWSTMTNAERGIICDWMSAMFGGYGMTVDCGNGTTVGSNTSQQACIDSVPTSCVATVAEIEACAELARCPDATAGLTCLLTACAP